MNCIEPYITNLICSTSVIIKKLKTVHIQILYVVIFVKVSDSYFIKIVLQFFMENGIPYDPEYVFHDVRVSFIGFKSIRSFSTQKKKLYV